MCWNTGSFKMLCDFIIKETHVDTPHCHSEKDRCVKPVTLCPYKMCICLCVHDVLCDKCHILHRQYSILCSEIWCWLFGVWFSCGMRVGAEPPKAAHPPRYYSSTLTTTPEPTVCPPSRMAKRRPSSTATGTISSTFICTLSPGMTISIPSGK